MATVSRVDALYTVETPEGVDFQFRIAGPGRRGFAFAIDTLIKVGVLITLGIGLAFFQILPGSIANAASGMAMVVVFVIFWFYNAVFETLVRGQTPGKWMLNLRVVRSNGTPIDALTAAGRSLLMAADVIPGTCLTAIVSMLCTRQMQRLGDLHRSFSCRGTDVVACRILVRIASLYFRRTSGRSGKITGSRNLQVGSLSLTPIRRMNLET